MTICRSLALVPLLSLPLLALASLAGAQESTTPAPPPAPIPAAAAPAAPTPAADTAPASPSGPYELEIGFRTLDVSGNEGMYRTQINERSGLLLRSFTLLTSDVGGGSSRFLDRLRVDASDLGTGPAGSLRIEADKSDVYRFRLGYRHSNAFSALPAFANPLLGQGIIPGQHTYNRTRHTLDADLDLLPGRTVSPFVGFSLNRFSGPGSTTYTLGGDDFRLSQDLKESEQEVRIGTGFNLGWLYGSATQGWRRARGSEQLTLDSADGSGNNAGPVLGLPVSAGTLTRDDRTRVNTPFTSLFATGRVGKSVKLSGNYVRFAADSSGEGAEAAAGSFVSFALGRFFNGVSETASSSARNTTWRGGASGEVALTDHVVAFAGYQKDHRELEGSALINTLYLQTLTFGGIDPRDVQAVLNARSSIDRSESVTNAGASASALGPFSVRIEAREARQSLSAAPDLSEILIPGGQGGDFERRVRTLDGSASFARSGFLLGAAYRHDRADDAIFRTDFRNRDRLRLRASWNAPKWLRAGVTREETKQDNDQPSINLDGKARQTSGDVELTPHEGIVLRASLSRFRNDSRILIRRPENFNTEPSLYAENGRAREGGILLNHAPWSLDLSAARFDNRGDNPFDIHRLRVRAGLDLPAKTRSGIVAEYAQDRYREANASYADFNARRFGLFLRYRP